MDTVNGLPTHVLLVHAIIVLLPLSALLLVLSALWPVLRRRLAGPNAILSLLVLVLVPVTTEAGEWLEHRVESSALVRAHAELGDTALFVALPVAVLALVVWWREREARAARPDGAETGAVAAARRTYLAPSSTAVGVVITVLVVLAAGAAVYDIYLIGDSGAKATWQGQFSQTSTQGDR